MSIKKSEQIVKNFQSQGFQNGTSRQAFHMKNSGSFQLRTSQRLLQLAGYLLLYSFGGFLARIKAFVALRREDYEH